MHANASNSVEEIPVSGAAVQDELVSSTTTSTSVQLRPSVSSAGGFVSRISFNVTRREHSRVVATKNGLASGKEDEEEDFDELAKKRSILSLENGVAIDAEAPRAKREKKVMVIPVLRLSTQSQIERLEKLVAEGTATDSDKARLALLQESVDQVDAITAGGDRGRNERITLADSDLQSGPTVVVADDAQPDYQSMPVGEFGLAFLRGCGWKDAQSCIGKSNPQAVPLRVSAPRPKGLGLGAALPSTAPPPSSSSRRAEQQQNRAGDEDEREKQLGKNAYVKCLGGLNKGAYGQVTSMDEENASVFVELAWPTSSAGKMVRVSQMAVEVIGSREFRDRIKSSAPSDAIRNGQKRMRV